MGDELPLSRVGEGGKESGMSKIESGIPEMGVSARGESNISSESCISRSLGTTDIARISNAI
jgi:hypothetical protein